jgi:hypothetical protein
MILFTPLEVEEISQCGTDIAKTYLPTFLTVHQDIFGDKLFETPGARDGA